MPGDRHEYLDAATSGRGSDSLASQRIGTGDDGALPREQQSAEQSFAPAGPAAMGQNHAREQSLPSATRADPAADGGGGEPELA